MRLTEKYRPTTLNEVIGQPPIALLKALARDPFECCVMLDGPPGCGKTAAALALAHELGCVDDFSGLRKVDACDFSTEAARMMFKETLMMMNLTPGARWKVLIIEELERLHQKVVDSLKTSLESDLPPHTIVVATSNDTSRLNEAFLERFQFRTFHAGKSFAVAAQQRLLAIWLSEGQSPERLPSGWQTWGWCGERYSMRVALGMMQDHLTVMETIG